MAEFVSDELKKLSKQILDKAVQRQLPVPGRQVLNQLLKRTKVRLPRV